MPTLIQNYSTDHAFLLRAAADAAGLTDPVPFNPRGYLHNLMWYGVRGPLKPIGDVLLRDWITKSRTYYAGTQFGIRVYTAGGVTFARVVSHLDGNAESDAYDFCVVSRADYLKLFRYAVNAGRRKPSSGPPPVMFADQFETLKQNTLGYLNRDNLKRIKELGGRKCMTRSMRPGRLNAGSISSIEQFVVNTYTTPSCTSMPSSADRNTAWSSVSFTVLRSRRATSMSSKKMIPRRFTVNSALTASTGLHDRRAAW